MPIRVYSSPDGRGRGRCIRFDNETPLAPLVLIATFLEDEEDARLGAAARAGRASQMIYLLTTVPRDILHQPAGTSAALSTQ